MVFRHRFDALFRYGFNLADPAAVARVTVGKAGPRIKEVRR